MADSSGTILPHRMSGVAGDAVGVLAYTLSSVGQAISMAALIFTGSLETGLPRAIASFCIAGGVIAIYIALRSRVVPAAAVIQDAPAIVLVAVAAAVGLGGAEATVADVFVLLLVTTVSTGLVMWLMGRLRLGSLVRYLPATVVGAFMAGTGWLLVKGGLDVMVGFGVGIGDLGSLFSGSIARLWIPGFAIGALLTAIGRSDRFPQIAVGGTVAACLAGFYVIALSTSSITAVEDAGWLIGPFPDGAGPRLIAPAELADTNWRTLVTELPGITSVVAVSVMVMLLNMTGISASAAKRLDVDAELRVAGEANLLCAPLGAAPGFHGLGDTLLLERLGARGRAVPIAAGVASLLFGVIGVAAIGYVPRLIVGSLLVTVGAALLIDWLKELTFLVSRVEQVLSLAILLVIASVGILEGIGTGLVAACAVFIVRYSRVDPLRAGGTAPHLRSRVDRSPAQVDALRRRADRLAVFELQGYLFFGSLTKLDDRFHGADGERLIGELDAVVLDFATVTGIDTSGFALIGQLVQELADQGSLVVISTLHPDLRRALRAAVPGLDHHVAWAATLDEALELAETEQLRLADDEPKPDVEPHRLLGALLEELDEVNYRAGEVVVEQGDDSDGMLIVTSGTMTAFRVDGTGRAHRLRQFGVGAMVGEIGLITGGVRSARVVAETDLQALWLSTERYHELRDQRAEAVFDLHEYIMRGQAERVVSLSVGLAQS